MKKQEAITVGQFATIRTYRGRGKELMGKELIDKKGCPSCGSITRYELKRPTMPAISTCSHVSGLESKGSAKKEIWLIKYTYAPKEPPRPKKKPSSAGREKVFFLDRCSQKIPIKAMLPDRRKCPECGKKTQDCGGSWNSVHYAHLYPGECGYRETVYVAPSCSLGDSDYAAGILAPTLWREQENLDRDLGEMGVLYSVRDIQAPTRENREKDRNEKTIKPGIHVDKKDAMASSGRIIATPDHREEQEKGKPVQADLFKFFPQEAIA